MSENTTSSAGDAGVSRRQFVRAVGASGVTAGVATGPVGAVQQQGATVQWVADQDFKDSRGPIVQALRDAGLSGDIQLDIIAGSEVTDDIRAQFQQWLSAGRNKPDLMRMDSGWTIPFIAREQLLNLSQNLPQEVLDVVNNEYFQASVSTATGPNGDLYGVPLYPDFPTMQYRKDLVEEAGFDPEGNNWATESITWQEFSEVTRTVMDQNPNMDYGFTFQAAVYEGLSCCDFNEFMTGWGGAYFGDLDNLFGPIGDRPVTVNEQQVIDSIRMIRTFIHGEDDQYALDGYRGGISPQAVLQWTENPSLAPFTNDDAVMHRNWPYAIVQNGTADNFGRDLGVMPIPYAVPPNEAKYEGTGGPTAALGGWHNTVNPNSQNKEAAFEVLRALTDDNVQLTIFEEVGWLPPKRALFNSPRAANVPIIGRYIDTLRVAGENAVPRPVTVVWPQESTRIAQQVNSAYSRDGNPKRAMTQLQAQLRQIEQTV